QREAYGDLGFHLERAEEGRVGPDSEVRLVQADLRRVAIVHAPQREDDVALRAVQEQPPRHVETAFDVHHAGRPKAYLGMAIRLEHVAAGGVPECPASP